MWRVRPKRARCCQVTSDKTYNNNNINFNMTKPIPLFAKQEKNPLKLYFFRLVLLNFWN